MIAAFLAVEYPTVIWLIHILHKKYNKQFSNNHNLQKYVIKNIAWSITLNTEETGVLDYDQQAHNNIIYNTLTTYLSSDSNITSSE